ILNKAYKQLEPYSNRVYCVAKFDIRKGKENRLEGKIKSVEKQLGKEVSK
ncbi:MAG: thiamine-binding protein, partial [Hydrogenothermus sp.]